MGYFGSDERSDFSTRFYTQHILVSIKGSIVVAYLANGYINGLNFLG